ncbi:MAG: hypothetical protein M3015_00200 [Bacteroidota bacterium]|nr:hypothetical protein [Bacteroidota bacterium]
MRSILFFLVLLCKLSNLQAQVLVHEEPRHHPVFQNNQIRILNVLLPPGDTTQYHIHHTPSVFILFTNTATGSQLKGGTSSTSKSTAGSIIFENLAPPHLRVHRVWNMDKDTFHVMDIELLSKDTGFAQKPLQLSSLQIAIDTSCVRAYRLTLTSGNNFIPRDKNRSLILISLDAPVTQTKQDGKTQDQVLKPGSYFEIKRNHSFSLKNIGDSEAHFALLELPQQ